MIQLMKPIPHHAVVTAGLARDAAWGADIVPMAQCPSPQLIKEAPMMTVNISIAALCSVAVGLQAGGGHWALALAYAGFGVGYLGLSFL